MGGSWTERRQKEYSVMLSHLLFVAYTTQCHIIIHELSQTRLYFSEQYDMVLNMSVLYKPISHITSSPGIHPVR